MLLFSGTAFHIKGTPVYFEDKGLLETLLSIFYLIGGELEIEALS